MGIGERDRLARREFRKKEEEAESVRTLTALATDDVVFQRIDIVRSNITALRSDVQRRSRPILCASYLVKYVTPDFESVVVRLTHMGKIKEAKVWEEFQEGILATGILPFIAETAIAEGPDYPGPIEIEDNEDFNLTLSLEGKDRDKFMSDLAEMLIRDPSGFTLVDSFAERRIYDPIEHSIPELFYAGAGFGRNIYKKLYPLTELT